VTIDLSPETLATQIVLATDGKSTHEFSHEDYLATWRLRAKINQLTDGQADLHIDRAREAYKLLTPLERP
jgi:hypothetical protein